MNKHETINYIEFPSKDLEKTKRFFKDVFGWSFQDFGESYTAFSDQGLDGGFYQSELTVSADQPCVAPKYRRGSDRTDIATTSGFLHPLFPVHLQYALFVWDDIWH